MKKLVILALIGLMFLSVSVVSASDNVTVEDEILADVNEDYNAEIVAKDYNSYYMSDANVKFDFKSYDGIVEDTRFDIIDNKNNKVIGAAYYLDGEEYGQIYADVGNYKATIKMWDFIDSAYKVKPVTFNVKITKAPVKLTASKCISTTKNHATLTATVKDKKGWAVEEGTVKFIVNGKSYTAKVKDGVAKKSVKLTKARIYTYRAIFSSKNYLTKKVSSKVYVKKAKSYYTFKVSKFTGKISYGDYLKLIKAKNSNKYKCIHIKLGKYLGKYPIHMYVETVNRDMLYPKGDYVHVWVNTGMGMDSPSYYKKINLYTLNP